MKVKWMVKMKQFNNITEVWNALDNGITINWSNDGYKVYIENAIVDNEYQAKHFTNRNGKVLSIRFIENYFGSLIDESELNKLYVKG